MTKRAKKSEPAPCLTVGARVEDSAGGQYVVVLIKGEEALVYDETKPIRERHIIRPLRELKVCR
jgi:hypothetical protein